MQSRPELKTPAWSILCDIACNSLWTFLQIECLGGGGGGGYGTATAGGAAQSAVKIAFVDRLLGGGNRSDYSTFGERRTLSHITFSHSFLREVVIRIFTSFTEIQ